MFFQHSYKYQSAQTTCQHQRLTGRVLILVSCFHTTNLNYELHVVEESINPWQIYAPKFLRKQHTKNFPLQAKKKKEHKIKSTFTSVNAFKVVVQFHTFQLHSLNYFHYRNIHVPPIPYKSCPTKSYDNNYWQSRKTILNTTKTYLRNSCEK